MKHGFLAATALTLSMAAPAVSAQGFSFDGAVLSFTSHDSDADYSGQAYEIGAEVSFGRVGGSVTFGQFAYDGIVDSSNYTVHLFYDVTESLTAGIFYNRDDWDGATQFATTGLEALYTAGAIEVEVAAGAYRYVGNGSSAYSYEFFSVDGAYDFGNGLSGLGSFTRATGNSEDLRILGLGVRYQPSDLFVEASVNQFSGSFYHQVLTVQVGYEFGSGTTFDGRGYTSVFGLY